VPADTGPTHSRWVFVTYQLQQLHQLQRWYDSEISVTGPGSQPVTKSSKRPCRPLVMPGPGESTPSLVCCFH
jgi:hypothetical protein